jgi:hypothetical protein
MAVDKRLSLTYAFTNLFFIASGAVTIAISILWKADAINNPSTPLIITVIDFLAVGPIEQHIIFLMTPTTFGLAAGIITLIAGLSSLPRIPPPVDDVDDSACYAKFSRMVTYSLVAVCHRQFITTRPRSNNLDTNAG